MKRLSARLIAAALVAAAAWLAGASFPRMARAQPSLTHATPGGLAPGKTTEVTLHGTKLDGPLRVWSSFPAQVEMLPADVNQKEQAQAVCKVTLGAGLPIGIGGIVVATADGSSDVLYVMIDDLPSVADSGNNHDATQPQEVSLPTAIDGQCDGTLFDYYCFTARAGQRISCEVVATRLGWDFDPLVRLLDARGNELLLADDDPSAGADPRFVFTAPADGHYLLELRDNRYKPGGRYRLRLGDFPFVSTPLPLAAQRGVFTTVNFTGPLTEGLAPLALMPVGAAPHETAISLGAKQPGGTASGWATLRVTDLPVFAESAPPVNPDEATSAVMPCVVAGLLEAAGDRDVFQFQGAKGARLRFRAITRSAGSAAVLSLRLLDAAGKQVAESPVTDSDEPVLNVTLPADGTYKLAVEELAGRGGVDYSYAVECRTGPQFSLLLKNDRSSRVRYSIPSGGAFFLDVQCQRSGYDGPITLGIDSLRVGWQAFNNVIPAKANEVRMYVLAPLDFAVGELAELRIVGRADASGGDTADEMNTTAQLRTARPQTPYPPAWHDGVIFVSGLGPKSNFFAVTANRNEINFPRLVGQTQFTLGFERTDPKFKDVPLTVLPLGLPTGVTTEVKRNGNGAKETYDIVFKGPKDLAEGQHTLRYFAYAEMAGQGRGVQSGDIRLNVITPLSVAVAPAGPLVLGQTQKVKLTLTRRGDDNQPVEVKFKSLPAGVSGPEKTTLTADQNEVELELSAAADAQPAKFEQFVAVATTKYAGTDITVESPPVALEVKSP